MLRRPQPFCPAPATPLPPCLALPPPPRSRRHPDPPAPAGSALCPSSRDCHWVRVSTCDLMLRRPHPFCPAPETPCPPCVALRRDSGGQRLQPRLRRAHHRSAPEAAAPAPSDAG